MGYLATGEDPQFSVSPERGRFPTGWAVVSYDGRCEDWMLQLRFYVDAGEGYSEETAVNLAYHEEGEAEELVRFPDRVVAMRLDPMSWDGCFELSNLRVHEIGKLGVLIFLLRYRIRTRDKGRVSLFTLLRRVVAASIGSDRTRWKARLVDNYKRSLREPDHCTPWFNHFRLRGEQLRELGAREWPAPRPSFSIVMPIHDAPQTWLREAIESVLGQIYAHWELLCIDDGSSGSHVAPLLRDFARRDPRIVFLSNERNMGVSAATNSALRKASGDYVCFMDHNDYLEPHALWRFADAIVSDDPDFLYSDEAQVAADDLNRILHVSARPAFSYDYYLSHPYFVHLVAVRRSLASDVQGLDESLGISQDVDFNLRALERAERVAHVPDILYRWREHTGSTGHALAPHVEDTTRAMLTRHLARLGYEAEVRSGPTFNVYDVRFFPVTRERVAIIIPTRNRCDLLRQCVDSIHATTPEDSFDLVVVDHESDDPETIAYLRGLAPRHTVIRYEGKFNFARLNNHAVAELDGRYDYLLFMNNDVEATSPGWFEKMLDHAKRPDVGVVGATLLFADRTVQHSGVTVGMYGCAEHTFKSVSYLKDGERCAGRGCSLVATRDSSAVTAACMMMRAEVFDEVGGFDEALVVGFNDTDLCLRVRDRGYKVLNHGTAVLTHYESATRGPHAGDPHPEDSAFFKRRYRSLIAAGDPYFSPLLCLLDPKVVLKAQARCPLHLAPRTVADFLPRRSGHAVEEPARADDR